MDANPTKTTPAVVRCLTSVSIVLLVLVTSPARAADEDHGRDAAKKDLERLQGPWTLVAMEVDGESLEPEDFQGYSSLYEGDALTLKAKDTVRRRGIVTLDAKRTPKAINTWDL